MIEYRTEDGVLVCVVPERADTNTCDKMYRILLERIEEEGLPVSFDMSRCTYVASAFLRICITVVQKVGKDQFTVVDISPDVKKVFKIAGLDTHLQID